MQEKDYAGVVNEARRRVVLAQTRNRTAAFFNVDRRVLGGNDTQLFMEHSNADLIIANCNFVQRGTQPILVIRRDCGQSLYGLVYTVPAENPANVILRPECKRQLDERKSRYWQLNFDTESVIVILVEATLVLTENTVACKPKATLLGVSPEALVHLARAGICPETIAQNILEN